MTDQDNVAGNEREVLSWEGYGDAVEDLAQMVAKDGFIPDVILSVARGGMPLGACLGYRLGIKEVSVVNVEFYTGVEERLPEPVLLPPTPPKETLAGKRVLIADDVADTGGTMGSVLDYLDTVAADVRVAVLYQKPHSTIDCEYVWRQTDEWIIFPWSAKPPILEGSVKDA
ncbi:phosphoribosyltransferase [Stomatohabitans albus]|uniref:phosphoribosyltransferase n=1 Tax=Stomatohabitans albus TaxID=3110766 RepID=UPI00300BFA34